ncbi:hypothetical protein SK128_002538, partial [Halocaridina rubra]
TQIEGGIVLDLVIHVSSAGNRSTIIDIWGPVIDDYPFCRSRVLEDGDLSAESCTLELHSFNFKRKAKLTLSD